MKHITEKVYKQPVKELKIIYYNCFLTLQVRDKRPTHMQNMGTTYVQLNACWKTHANTRICVHLRTLDARVSFCYSLS